MYDSGLFLARRIAGLLVQSERWIIKLYELVVWLLRSIQRVILDIGSYLARILLLLLLALRVLINVHGLAPSG